MLAKIKRPEGHYQIGTTDDIGGCRMILKDMDQVEDAIDMPAGLFTLKQGGNSIKNYIEEPRRCGYRSCHLITVNPGEDRDYRVEVQIRTKLQHLWSTAVEAAQEIIAEQAIVGDPSRFAIGYAFIGDDRTTEISIWADDVNLLAFTRGGQHLTTRWAYLESLVAWLEQFARTMRDDPYPLDVEGEFAAEKDANARSFESDDLDELDAYYDSICDWAYEHSWVSERAGAIVSDMLFEYKRGTAELSWDNRSPEDGVVFDCEFGGVRVDAATFKAVVLEFVDAYEKHWGIKVDDESTWARS